MLVFNEDHYKELCDLIKYDNAVLFLGQDYRKAFDENNAFIDTINRSICNNKVSDPSYISLWEKMSSLSLSNKKEGGHPTLDDSQIRNLVDYGYDIPQSEKISKTLNTGWASIVTSAIDPGLVNAEGVNCNPIYNVNTRPAGLANKKRLHITHIYGCVAEDGSYPTSYRIRNKAKDNAKEMYKRVLDEAIPFSGALVIDGWDPSRDWATEEIIFGNSVLDADMPYPKIYLFNCTAEIKDRLTDCETTEEFVDSDKLIISEHSLYECIEEYINAVAEELRLEKETRETAEIISFIKGKKEYQISIPRRAINDLNQDIVHLMMPKDRIQTAFDRDGLRNATIKFLSSPPNRFPYWQGYHQGCFFNRDIYQKENKKGVYDRVVSILQSHNLHKENNTIIIHGPSNSGKTMLLGKLALDLSAYYPVLFINGEIETNDPDITKYRYHSIISFINDYLTRNAQTGARVRAVIIWDNNVYVDKLSNYLELAKELSESNALLIGSAYELRDVGSDLYRPKDGVEYFPISPVLSAGTEMLALENMLRNNLGKAFLDAFNKVKKANASNSNKSLIRDGNRILSLLQRTFSSDSFSSGDIVDRAEKRTKVEFDGSEDLMRERFETAINDANKTYLIDADGLPSILKSYTNDGQKSEDWYKQLEICAPTLNDILAMSGQFGIRLPLNLVKRVLCDQDICPDILYYMDDVDDILAADTMLEFPFPVDDVGHVMVGYRSPSEADLYLQDHYNSRGKIDKSITVDNEGNEFLEDREIYLLEKIIEHSNLEDYSSTNWNVVTTVRELLDQFGSNSRKGEAFSKRFVYKYDELANTILNHGGNKNPEMALIASFLKREQIVESMLEKVTHGYNISDTEKKILDEAAFSLEHAMEIEANDNTDSTTRMMRLLIEWCTNRNYTLNREKPGVKDLELYKQIRSRFAKALSIYQKQDVRRMKPISMLDVYLNAFCYYADAMEAIYHVESEPKKVPPLKMNDYNNEISFAMTSVLGKLLNFDEIDDSRENLNRKILRVYSISKKSSDLLQTTIRAHGSAAFIHLCARNLWIQNDVSYDDLQDVREADLYLTSDYVDRNVDVSDNMFRAAKNVYEYLTEPKNKELLLSKKNQNDKEKEVGALEMLIRAAWIVKTRKMPFTLNQFPALSRTDWDELHSYCKVYTESENERARYAFAYYLEGIYYWTFMPDSYDYFLYSTPSQAKFSYCNKSGFRPRGVYSTDSFIYLCELNTQKPVKFNARIRSEGHLKDFADITSAYDHTAGREIPFVLKRKNIYCAQSLQRMVQKTKIQSRIITIRFNLQGPLAGPENPEKEVTNSYGKE